jgi:hypothetical protein
VIVRTFTRGLEFITQPDHAALAGRIMAHATALERHPRRDVILHAIAGHDNGWVEEDASPLVDAGSGRAHDFVTVPAGVRQRVWPRAVGRLADTPWAAALVAHHAITVYDRFRADGDWTSFFADMTRRRDALREREGLPLETLLADYTFLRVGDLISLAFCTGGPDPWTFSDWTVRLDGTRVGVLPDLFGGRTVLFEIGARAVPRQSFRDDADLADALEGAERVTLTGEARAV